jgi:hypothetical protein
MRRESEEIYNIVYINKIQSFTPKVWSRHTYSSYMKFQKRNLKTVTNIKIFNKFKNIKIYNKFKA